MAGEDDSLLSESDYTLAPGVRVSPAGLRLQYSRAGGPGGQNVNKVNTKAEAWISLDQISGLSAEAILRLKSLMGRRLTIAGELHFVAVEHRTQEANRREIFERLRRLILQAQTAPKPRKKTRPSAGARKRRLEGKRRRSEIKKGRSGKEW
jgi:ribosome-associated protein